MLVRLGVGGFLAMNIMLLSLLLYSGTLTAEDHAIRTLVHIVLWVLTAGMLLVLGAPFFREALGEWLRYRLNSATLIVLGVLSAFAYSTVEVLRGGEQVYFDTATMVLMLFTYGRYLEATGRARAARDLSPLLEAEKQSATVIMAGAEVRRSVLDIPVGTLIRVSPGELIPLDAKVTEGTSYVNEAVLTGESRPVQKGPGMIVRAGSLNQDGVLALRTTAVAGQTRWAQICQSVREALARKGPLQSLADKLAIAFVPIVMVVATLTVVYWLEYLPLNEALMNGLAVLVVACPCALGLAAPLASSLGIGRMARRGCVVRHSRVPEVLAGLRGMAFDKTGTLTKGASSLLKIITDGASQEEVLRNAMGLEQHLDHALARGIVEAARSQHLEPAPVSDVRAIPGHGIVGRLGMEPIAAGSQRWFALQGWKISKKLQNEAVKLNSGGHSLVVVGWGDSARGLLVLDDPLLPEAVDTLKGLSELGLKTWMLTGDLPAVAKRLSGILGLTDWRAQLTPEEKVETLRELAGGGSVAVVGDGLNDGPVLSEAALGIAVGSATDLARETADLVLPAGRLDLLPWLVEFSRTVRKIMIGNLAWAFAYNIVAMVMAASGYLPPVLAAVLMAGSSLVVVMNSLRLERVEMEKSYATNRINNVQETEATLNHSLENV